MKNRFYFVIFLGIFFNVFTEEYTKKNTWGYDNLNLEEIEQMLMTGKIKHCKCIAKSNTNSEVLLITLEHGLKAVFKSRIPLHNLAEVAAYRASKFLSNNSSDDLLVPPTVLRTINGREGSLQLWIASTQRNLNFKDLPIKIKSDANIFSFIFGRIDWTNNLNIIIPMNNEKKVILIDNATTGTIQKTQYGKPPFHKISTMLENIEDYNSQIFPIDKAKFFTREAFLTHKLPKSLESFIGSAWAKLYVIFKKHIWFQTDPEKFNISYTRHYSLSTLDQYRKLSKDSLKEIWNISSYYQEHEEYFDELFDEVLDRKNQLLLAAKFRAIEIYY